MFGGFAPHDGAPKFLLKIYSRNHSKPAKTLSISRFRCCTPSRAAWGDGHEGTDGVESFLTDTLDLAEIIYGGERAEIDDAPREYFSDPWQGLQLVRGGGVQVDGAARWRYRRCARNEFRRAEIAAGTLAARDKV